MFLSFQQLTTQSDSRGLTRGIDGNHRFKVSRLLILLNIWMIAESLLSVSQKRSGLTINVVNLRWIIAMDVERQQKLEEAALQRMRESGEDEEQWGFIYNTVGATNYSCCFFDAFSEFDGLIEELQLPWSHEKIDKIRQENWILPPRISRNGNTVDVYMRHRMAKNLQLQSG